MYVTPLRSAQSRIIRVVKISKRNEKDENKRKKNRKKNPDEPVPRVRREFNELCFVIIVGAVSGRTKTVYFFLKKFH